MKKRACGLLLLVSAQLVILPTVAANVFFKIEHQQHANAQPSYLLGTMHLLCENRFIMPKAVQDVTAAVDQLIVEVDLTDADELREAQQASFQQPPNYLRNYLNVQAYNELAEQTQQQLQIPLDALAPLRPMIISSLFLANSLTCKGNTFSLDERLIMQAAATNKTIVGLETARWQLMLFDQIDLAQQVDALFELVSNPNETQRDLTRMATIYMSGNGEKLHKELIAQDDFMGASALFLDDRNKTWVQQLPQLIATNSSLIAVGAGHLYGQYGLLKLLADKGFEITPIPVRFDTVESH